MSTYLHNLVIIKTLSAVISSHFSPLFHPRLNLDLLVPGEHDPDADVSGVGLLLPQEVVDPGLNVRAEPSDLELLSSELVIFLRCPRCLVASVTFKSKNIDVNIYFFLKTIFETYVLEILSI